MALKISDIARSNDEFRASIVSPELNMGKRLVFSLGFGMLPSKDIENILQQIAKFDDFNEGNDPWGEHDFGTISTEWAEIFWTIATLDEEQNTKVLTVMLAEEY